MIALGLEGLVEWQHHRHLVQEAKETIHREIVDNAKIAELDLKWVQEDEERIKHDLETLLQVRSGKKIEHGTLEYNESWDSFRDSAWQTAHATGAMNYFPYSQAQDIAEVYAQQAIVATEGVEVFRSHTQAISPMFITGDPNAMSREEIQLSLQRTSELLLRLKTVEQLLGEIREEYTKQLKKQE